MQQELSAFLHQFVHRANTIGTSEASALWWLTKGLKLTSPSTGSTRVLGGTYVSEILRFYNVDWCDCMAMDRPREWQVNNPNRTNQEELRKDGCECQDLQRQRANNRAPAIYRMEDGTEKEAWFTLGERPPWMYD